MNELRFKTLLDRYIADQENDDDRMELIQMIRSGEYDQLLQQFIEDIYHTEDDTEDVSPSRRQELLHRIFADQETEANTSRSSRSIVIRYWRAAAAVILLIISGTGYFYRQQQKAAATSIGVPVSTAARHTDVAPGTTRAILTLADGSSVPLDTTGWQVLQVGNTAIRQYKGQLLYENHSTGKEISYNTLTTPKGGQYRLLLPDGTDVWLNAGSSLRYPVAFTGNERKVILTGEAYFEVVHDNKKPFRIAVGNQLVEDLGTHFNINAYADEPIIKTTLLEGAVKINNTLLQPGEQAQVNKNGNISVIKNINVADVVAWKNGFFLFRNDHLKTVMREIARWYDVEIIYPPDINNNQQFSGRIDRSLTLTQVLNGLALTKAHFKIEDNRKVVILP